MQSYADMNNTTGMTLRSGKTYYKTTSQWGTPSYELDGEDFFPLTSLSEYSWTWAQKVHETLSKTDDWSAEAAYNFLSYLESTASTWCQTAWSSQSDDTIEFSEYLMGLVRGFAEEANAVKHYPNTRSKDTLFGADMGFCNGIIRLSKEIELEWNVARNMAQAEDYQQEQHQDEQMEMEEEDYSAASCKQELDFDGEVDYYSQGGYGHA